MHDNEYMVGSCTMAKSLDRQSARLRVDLPAGGMVKPQGVPAGGMTLMRKDQIAGSLGRPYASF